MKDGTVTLCQNSFLYFGTDNNKDVNKASSKLIFFSLGLFYKKKIFQKFLGNQKKSNQHYFTWYHLHLFC